MAPTLPTLPAEMRLEIYRFALGMSPKLDIEVVPQDAIKRCKSFKIWCHRTAEFHPQTRKNKAKAKAYWMLHGADVRELLALSRVDRNTHAEVTDLVYGAATFHVWIGTNWESTKMSPLWSLGSCINTFATLSDKTVFSRIQSLNLVVRSRLNEPYPRRHAAVSVEKLVHRLTGQQNKLKKLTVRFCTLLTSYGDLRYDTNTTGMRARRFDELAEGPELYQHLLDPLVELGKLQDVVICGGMTNDFAEKLKSVLKGTHKGDVSAPDEEDEEERYFEQLYNWGAIEAGEK
ncbi:hypothetical protein NA57DRAFT_59154 [Rhizodiscina lignyota]|uniref:Uncharacterized protein n=1 Tax=Rhizodiscina lignyota TaxID=1504668 RepID=A0A9P4I6X1_9PEZI|nr:hypothetical protein NA57DRAFT_59154 [Rhizodiscina lignyota]